MSKITVVIPLYNKAAYIRRALDSALAQTERDFEIVIIDDGSTDCGGEIVKSYSDPRIKYIRQKNAGVSAARNAGINAAAADLVAFLDADDAYKPRFLETMLRLKQQFPTAGIYAAEYQICYKNGEMSKPANLGWEGLIPNYFKFALDGRNHEIWTSAVVVPKHVFNQLGYFNPDVPYGEDLEMWLRIAVKYPVAYAAVIGATYYQDDPHSACNDFLHVANPVILTAIRNHLTTGSNDPLLAKMVKEYHDLLVSRFIRRALSRGNTTVARQLLQQYFERRKYFYIFSALAIMPVSLLKSAFKCGRCLKNLCGIK